MVSHIHGGVDSEQEKLDPQTVTAAQQVWIRAHDQCKRFAMAELVVTPSLEPTKDGVETLVGVLF